MPPKYKFTKEEIVKASIEIVNEKGFNNISAREVAKKLNSSSKVIFNLFGNMQGLISEVISYGYNLYENFTKEVVSKNKYPTFKATGIAYILFAKEHTEIFKMLFMRKRSTAEMISGEDDLQPLISVIVKNTGISEEVARKLHIENWIFVHGIAVMIATNYLEWDMPFIDNALTDVYLGVLEKLKKDNE